MNKRLLALLLTLTLVASLFAGLLTVGASAEEDEDFTIEDGVLTAYNGAGGNVEIPSTVTSIGDRAFEYSGVTSVIIPDGVTSIGDYAFAQCYILTSIIIPNSVTSIGEAAFDLCEKLTSITIPYGVTRIGRHAFTGTALTSIIIPDSVTSLGVEAFRGCESLTNVTIPASVESIGEMAFTYCSALTSLNVDVNNQYYSSIDGVLFNKEKTTLITYPKGKNGKYDIPASVTSIGDWAFDYCDGLTNVIIPASVTSIGICAFECCTGLTSVTIPDSVTSIGSSAFYGDTLTIYGYAGSYAEEYADENDIPFIAVEEQELIDNTSGIAITGLLEIGVGITVNIVEDLSPIDGVAKITAFDITLLKDGVAVQPNGTVTVTIPVPAGYDADKLAVYHIDGETAEEVEFTLDAAKENVVFSVDHFSIYAVAELSAATTGDKVTTADPTSPPTGVETHLGVWLALCGVSLLAVAGLVTVQARKKSK